MSDLPFGDVSTILPTTRPGLPNTRPGGREVEGLDIAGLTPSGTPKQQNSLESLPSRDLVDFSFGKDASGFRSRESITTRDRLQVGMVDLAGEFKVRPEWAEAYLRQYYEVFEAAFPDTKERPPLDILREQVTRPGATLRLYVFEIDGLVVGGEHLRLINTGQEIFGFVEHLWVSKSVQRGGLGGAISEMTENVLRKHGASFSLAEFNDPSLMSDKERSHDLQSGITAESRLRFWKRQGYRMIDAPYVQPALHNDEDPVQYLMLGVKILNPDAGINGIMSAAMLSRALHHFFDSFAPRYMEEPLVRDVLGWVDQRSEVVVRDLIEEKRYFHQRRTDLN